MKKVIRICLSLFIAFQLAACGIFEDASSETTEDIPVMTPEDDLASKGAGQKVEIPREIEEIPLSYFDESAQPITIPMRTVWTPIIFLWR